MSISHSSECTRGCATITPVPLEPILDFYYTGLKINYFKKTREKKNKELLRLPANVAIYPEREDYTHKLHRMFANIIINVHTLSTYIDFIRIL